MKKIVIIIAVFIFGYIYFDYKIKYFNNNQEKEKIRDIKIDNILENNSNDIKKNIEEGDGENINIDNMDNINKENSFFDNFSDEFILEESGNMESSLSDNWWVNSGAFLYSSNGTGKTIFGELKKNSKWQEKYKDYNSSETDTGYHPQNIFRLVTRSKWQNFNQECYYKINRYIISNAKERSESNGILLFNRYQDEDNLYYTGLRVDGTIVIKKKYRGEYYLMAQKIFFTGIYKRKINPNLLPIGRWIGLKSEVINNRDQTVSIKVYVDKNNSGQWNLAIETVDDGKRFGGVAIKKEGYAGIRTDFMDVEFDNYKIKEIN